MTMLLGCIFCSCSKLEKSNQTVAEIIVQNERFKIVKYTEHGQDWFAARTTATARSGTFIIEVILDRNLTIQDVKIPSYPLSHGQRIQRPDFLNQFKTKTAADPPQINRDIHAVTGATLSSTAVANTVRDILAFVSRHKEQLV